MSKNDDGERKTRRRLETDRLPTPPPDPRKITGDVVLEEDRERSERELIALLEAFQKSANGPSALFAPAIATKDAFDHLERLYKLMEQMLNLKEQNARLQRRVRDLEQLKNFQELYRELGAVGDEIADLDSESLTESVLDTILLDTKKELKPKPPSTRSILRQSILKPSRHRSSSLNADKNTDLTIERRASSVHHRETNKPSKVSKWTKVKAAFKWEKASPTVSGAKSQDSGIAGILPLNYELSKFLRVPSTSDDVGASPTDSGAADNSTPGSLSSASSLDDIHRQDRQTTQDDSHASDDCDRQIYTKDSSKRYRLKPSGSKSSRTPWAKMKNIVPTRSSLKQKRNAKLEDLQIEPGANSEHEDDLESSDKSSIKVLQPNEVPFRVVTKYQQLASEDSDTSTKPYSKWTRVKKAFLTNPLALAATPSKIDTKIVAIQPIKPISLDMEDLEDTTKIKAEIQKNYEELQNKLSLEFQEKLREWEKMKQSGPSGLINSTISNPEECKDQAFIKKMEQWHKLKAQPPKSPLPSQESLPPEFKKKLDEWQKLKRCPSRDEPSTSSGAIKKRIGEWPKWKSVGGPKTDSPYESRPLTDEFLKKLEVWRQLKVGKLDYVEKTPSPKIVRRLSTDQDKKVKDRNQKELHWVDKELNKIEKEKQRLERERQRYIEREERLVKQRLSLIEDKDKKDILVQTPGGCYKFEGISRQFAQKLYEWEKSQGIGPEASTFALLATYNPDLNTWKENRAHSASPFPGFKLSRSKSAESVVPKSSGQLLNSHNPSSLSLNDMDELERQCLQYSCESPQLTLAQSIEEPEAVIVEVEDLEEQTAELLEEDLQEKLFPIYQHEGVLNNYQENACVASHVIECPQSLDGYNLIEEISSITRAIAENEKRNQEISTCLSEVNSDSLNKDNLGKEQVQEICDNQKQCTINLLVKIANLQEQFHNVFNTFSRSTSTDSTNDFSDLRETANEIFTELLQLAEKLKKLIHQRTDLTHAESENVSEISKEIKAKLFEIQRTLDFIHASSDTNKVDASDSRKRIVDKRTKFKNKTFNSRTVYESEEESSTSSVPSRQNTINKKSSVNNPKKSCSIAPSSSSKGLPPLPTSPTPQRKLSKDISPNIRLMMAKYNQMVTKQEVGIKSNPSSGSASPVAWRSPISERRVVKTQTVKYLEEVKKVAEKEVKKSASATLLNGKDRNPKIEVGLIQEANGLRTSKSSTDVTRQKRGPTLKLNISEPKNEEINDRSSKLLKAKEDFLNSPVIETSSAPPLGSKEMRYPARNRYSQISVGSESSCDSSLMEGLLVKSASAGMINVDEATYRQIDPAFHQDGYVSLPRSKKLKESLLQGKLALANIASKFRKVRMRRTNKDGRKKLNTVSALCRQSLVVDLHPEGGDSGSLRSSEKRDSLTLPTTDTNSSDEPSPSNSRSGSWIKKLKPN